MFYCGEHIKLGIPIHPAGEWLLDNFYLIEETYKTVIKELPLKKYKKFVGISNGTYQGFARIYVLASQIVAYTNSRIDSNAISQLLGAYQKKKNLSMDEIWNIGVFIQIALIEKIKDICEKIFLSQMQKYRVENILEKIIENKKDVKFKNLGEYKQRVKGYGEMKYPFIEYMSYRLKKYGKSAYSYINALEEEVNKLGTTIDDVVRKEHFDIALKKVEIANSIMSIKELLRMDFTEIFQSINEVEEILKKDPAGVYPKMDHKTKELYRNSIKEISEKTKISEKYIVNKILEICINAKEKIDNSITNNTTISDEKKTHVGYYIIDEGKEELISKLTEKNIKKINYNIKAKIYALEIWIISLVLDFILTISLYSLVRNDILNNTISIIISLCMYILMVIPIEQIITKIIQYILGKIVKPKQIPKIDILNNKIGVENRTFVVIPTIIKDRKKVVELMKKLEVYYLANKSENLYLALLGDCSSGPNKDEKYDEEIIFEGIRQTEKLNNKYKNDDKEIPKFSFLYRKRFWNGKEECYLGWERKRGLLTQFNEYILGHEENVFKINTIEDWKKKRNTKELPKIKYVITLDNDTQLVLNTGLELIGAMSHILNKPELNDKKDAVIKGHALIQPRIGIDLNCSRKNLFTKIYVGSGGIDPYTNAISDIYQDNFDEGIFTGKGIYDLGVFSKVLKNQIPENIVLSHDLLEGSYLRCGLASNIMLIDEYPRSYLSFRERLHRWIRGDVQIYKWLKGYIIDRKENKIKNPLNFLSKYKILDNLIRELLPISIIGLILFSVILYSIYKINICIPFIISLITVFIPTILDLINRTLTIKEGNKHHKRFVPTINPLFASLLRGIIDFISLPDKAYISNDAMIRSIYRMKISDKHLLEWTTSEDAEKKSKKDLKSYFKRLVFNCVFGLLILMLGITDLLLGNLNSSAYMINSYGYIITTIGLLWTIAPIILWYIGKDEESINLLDELNNNEKEYLIDIGKKTWQYFKDTINDKNNYLPPDNYQEDRKPKFIPRTSCTNIGLGLLAIISSYDLGYSRLHETLYLLSKMLETIEKLPRWNGHLYNWYSLTTLEPLTPKYISTVDSGNFISYIYVLKSFYVEIRDKIINNIDLTEEEKEQELSLIPYWIDMKLDEIPIAKADFKPLYDKKKKLFSIGFNIEDNKLTDSYYDLLASEARNASFVAIGKKDVPVKHWNSLNRTLTALSGYKGLISWAGTAFEYLMPTINMKNYKGSLLDESYKFMLANQKQYAKKLGIPWGFSETAFNLKDLNNNYQYKAIGIPWLGLKRGLEDDIVVASYASALALSELPKQVVDNFKKLEKYNMMSKYGFFESIDFTPLRLRKKKEYETVKTYMAHHEALILLSINNLFNDGILQKRFHENPEIEALEILLQEKMPENMIITNEEKKKPEKIRYVDYENYAQRTFNKVDEKIPIVNCISNESYQIIMDQYGNGYSKYKNILINKYKPLSDEIHGINFYLKNIKNKRIWSSNYLNYLPKPDKYEIAFSEDIDRIKRIDGSIETIMTTTVAQEEMVEIRNLEIKNNGLEEETLEITSYLEPILCMAKQEYAHPAFNKLFLNFEHLDNNVLLVKRRIREKKENKCYLAITLISDKETIGDFEYEIDKEKFVGRGNIGIPDMVENSKPFSKNTNLSLNPIIAMKRTVNIKPKDKINISLVISIGETQKEAVDSINKYMIYNNIKQCFELSRARTEAEAMYLGLNNKEIETYQTMLGLIIKQNPYKKIYLNKISKKNYPQSELWKYGISGDLPIVLLKINNINEIYVLDDLLKAYEFYRTKNINIDLVIYDEEENNYERYVKEEIVNSILNKNLSYMQNIQGGIYIIDDIEAKELLEFKANIVIDGSKRTTCKTIKRFKRRIFRQYKRNWIRIQTTKIY